MIQRLGKWSVVLMLVTLTGTHWLFLQSVAWVSMTVTFARTESLPTALEKTFDGQHPCSLCKAVAEGRQEEKRQAAQVPTLKLELFFEAQAVVMEVPAVPVTIPAFFDTHSDRSEPPPVPPPRRA